jgi:thiol-disulfide isomerase/thioredoxin
LVLVFSLAASAETLPKLDLRDLKGTPHSLSEFRGKIIVLNFWATYCVPCTTEMPMLSQIQEQYKDRIVVVAASVDDEGTQPAVAPFIHKLKVENLNVMLGASLDDLHPWGLQEALPGTVFIDAEGNIVARVKGQLKRPELEKQLKEMLAMPKAAGGNPPAAPRS